LANQAVKKGVYKSIMNRILSVCSEYSDNVWYSGLESGAVPMSIAIEIEREYKFAFLKTMLRLGYELESLRRGDDRVSILTLTKIQSQKSMLI
jgi:hypothetical protein